MTARAASPIRASPAANIGLPHSAPPDGLTATPSPGNPSASRSSGLGTHYCLGASLAKLEIELIFTAIADAMPDIAKVGDPVRLRSGWINSIKLLPVTTVPGITPPWTCGQVNQDLTKVERQMSCMFQDVGVNVLFQARP